MVYGRGPVPGATQEEHLAWVVPKTDNAIHRRDHYPVESVVCYINNTYPLDSDLSGGERYPAFEQPGPEV